LLLSAAFLLVRWLFVARNLTAAEKHAKLFPLSFWFGSENKLMICHQANKSKASKQISGLAGGGAGILRLAAI